MNLRLAALLVCCQGLFAQDTSADKPIQVIRVKGDALTLCGLVKGAPGVDCQGDRALRAVVIKRVSGGRETDLESVARTIHELDTLENPADVKNIELTTVIVAGSMQKVPGTQEIAGEGLGPVVKQLRSIFPYTTYEVLGSMLLRVRRGGIPITSQGSFKWFEQGSHGMRSAIGYVLSYGTVTVSEDGLIHLNDVHFDSAVPIKWVGTAKDGSTTTTSTSQQPVRIGTFVDLREGQKVVVGSAAVADEDVCLFLVVSARLV